MSKSTYFSPIALVYHGRQLPEQATIVGYGSIINALKLDIPMPSVISVISHQNKKYRQENWVVYPKSYLPKDTLQITEIEALYQQLVFALKYEGVNLLVFKKLTQYYSLEQLNNLVSIEPTGQYSRRIWFLIEWLGGVAMKRENLLKKSYVPLLDETIQYAAKGVKSTRHLIINNLPGTVNFCPLVFKTPTLDQYIKADLAQQQKTYLNGIRRDLLQRASSFLLLKDSRASYTIEGESPKSKRAVRWGQAIGQAGMKDLSENELLRLQQLVIENPKFISLGYRKKGGFVGEHDRITGEPVPDHISAKWQDIESLMNGLLNTYEQLSKDENFDAVICAAIIAFGFVFIHPFEDGNGRLHRYIIHHILAKKKFSQQGFIFPVSAAILNKIDEYRKILEYYSLPLLDFIQWIETKDHNIEVLNYTIDFYRYFDATKQAEFLYNCVNETIESIIPDEVEYLLKYDYFKNKLEDAWDMPDSLISLLVIFLEQNNGQLSKRARENEFVSLSDMEVHTIEGYYKKIFMDN